MDRAEFDEYVLKTYSRMDLTLVKGAGSRVWDDEGREYLDFFPGFGAGNMGHCHPAVTRAVTSQLQKIIHVPNVYYSNPQGELAKMIVEHTFPGKVFFCNSGSEANEGAIKFARKLYKDRHGKHEIISLNNSFHGRTFGSMTATGQEKIREGFAPLPQGFLYCEHNNTAMLETMVNEHTAAIILEPVQGEGGIYPVSREFLQKARTLCDRFDCLLILDEVQTGIGRTARLFAYEYFDVRPDILTMAKSLGGGLPIGAFLVSDSIPNSLVPGSHGSTFGGNALCCAAAIAVLTTLFDEGVLAGVLPKSKYFLGKLFALQKKFPLIKETRHLGMMIGVELTEDAAPIAKALREKAILVNVTRKNVLRLMPALTVEYAELNRFITAFEQVLKNFFRN